jgi:SRSO17 transposase
MKAAFPNAVAIRQASGRSIVGRPESRENCQVGVFLSYVTARGHALIDRELYLPEDWCADLPRRHAAHIPETITFQTKPELAKLMVHRAQAARLPFRWVVADTVYGHCPDLRLFLEEPGHPYALAVPSTEVACVQTRTGLLLADVASIAQQALRAREWQRLSASQGTKGERLFDWARLPIMVQAIGGRWHIEEDLQACKDLGLDHYEVRSYLGWYRHLTLVLLAYAFLVGITVQNHLTASARPAESAACSPLIPLTTSEARHLLASLFWPAPTSVPLLCQWSWWRRTHQYWAGYYHRRRRAKAG